MVQWHVAAEQPAHLAGIAPLEAPVIYAERLSAVVELLTRLFGAILRNAYLVSTYLFICG